MVPALLLRKPPEPVSALRWVGQPDGINEDGTVGATLTELGLFGATVMLEEDGNLALLAGVNGAQGWVHVPAGHWVMKASAVDFYPVDHDYLLEHYEFVG